jgi:hypothetical protein
MTSGVFSRSILVLVVVLLGLSCLGTAVPLEGILFIAFGWIGFLFRVLPKMQADWSGVSTGLVALMLLSGGLHFFLQWLYRVAGVSARAESDTESNASTVRPRHWRPPRGRR